MSTINTKAMYSSSQLTFKGKDKSVKKVAQRVIPQNIEKQMIGILENNKNKQIIPQELLKDLPAIDIEKKVSELTKKAQQIDLIG